MKVCFVTTGATAPFTALIESVLKPASLDALLNGGYTHLLVQFGSAKDVYLNCAKAAQTHLEQGSNVGQLEIAGIAFREDGLKDDLVLVRESQGLVISHAGSGSILEALRYQVPLVVVPNTALLDNHQEELAVAMEKQNYVLRGDVNNLVPAIEKSSEFRSKLAQFPPITSGTHREMKSVEAMMDETMGYLD